MLSIIADALLRSTGQTRWDAPSYDHQARGPRSNIEIEREAARLRHRAHRDMGLW